MGKACTYKNGFLNSGICQECPKDQYSHKRCHFACFGSHSSVPALLSSLGWPFAGLE